MLELLSSFVLGIVTGIFDGVIGAGGLIAIPGLIFLGLTPAVAIATDRLAVIGSSLSATWVYWKEGKVDKKLFLNLSLITIIGAAVGSLLLLQLPTKAITTIVGIVMLAFIPILLFNKKEGLTRVTPTQWKIVLGYVLYLIVEIYASMIGAGAGILALYLIVYCFGLTMIEANATSTASGLLLTIIASAIFAYNGKIDYPIAIAMMLGMFLGGYLGAKLALWKGNSWLKILFIITIILAAVKLFVF